MEKTYIHFKYGVSLLLLVLFLYLDYTQFSLLNGNAGPLPATPFIRTIDYENLNFCTNNQSPLTNIHEVRLLIDSNSRIRFDNPDVYSEPMIYMLYNSTEILERMAPANSFYHPDWGLSKSLNGIIFLSTTSNFQ